MPAVSRRRLAPLALLLAAALIAAVALVRPAAEAEAKPSPEFFGVVPISVGPGDIDKMAALGVRTLRTGIFWPAVEPTPGNFQWGAYDTLFAGAAEAGIRIFPTLFGTPGWVNFLAGRNQCGHVCAPEGTSSRNAFATFAKAAVERYGPEGDFWKPSGGECGIPTLCPYEDAPCGCTKPMPILSWQVWNEQNSPKYYLPEPDPTAYAQIVATVGPAIKSVDPRADVVIGGMWGPPDADSVVHTIDYLREFYAVPNIENAFDSLAIHPYAPTLAGMRAQMTRVRQAVRRFGDPSVGTWITELGWASGGPKSEGLVKTPRAQARLLTESFRYLIKRRKAWKLRGIQWFTWRDAGLKEDGTSESDCKWCARAGLLTNGGVTKPAGRAFQRLALGSG